MQRSENIYESLREVATKYGERPPRNRSEFDKRIFSLAEILQMPVQRVQVLVKLLLVSQFLPPQLVLRGGTGIALRSSEEGTRFTKDIDLVSSRNQAFEEDLRALLAQGIGEQLPSKKGLKRGDAPKIALQGELAKIQTRAINVPEWYSDKRFDVHLYLNEDKVRGSLGKITVEVGNDELERSEEAVLQEVAPLYKEIMKVCGFELTQEIQFIPLGIQIAQKLHGCSGEQSDRVHDVLDLQILERLYKESYPQDSQYLELKEICVRIFAYRKSQEWPPEISMSQELEGAYQEAFEEAEGAQFGYIETLDGACEWANGFISRIDQG